MIMIIVMIYNDKCGQYYVTPQTIQHITEACKTIALTDYKHWHDQVTATVHQSLALKYTYKSIQEKVAYYKYINLSRS